MPASRHLRHIFASVIIVVLLVIFGRYLYTVSPAHIKDQLSLPSLPSILSPIPNIVHYVILKKDEKSTLDFRFDHFLSIYGSLMYFKPTPIFLHTDYDAATIEQAAATGNKWTRAILNLPKVKTNQVVSPTHSNGRQIQNVEHKSDFVRINELYRSGGIYMDLDVLPLRDLKPLRYAGYKSVVGRQYQGGINNGVILAQKEAALVYIMQRDGPLYFNGKWDTHSVKLITPVAQRLVKVPNEVLIMDEKAFSPTSWTKDSMNDLFKPHKETSPPHLEPQIVKGDEDPITLWDSRKTKSRTWELDLSSTYLLHAYKTRGYKVSGFDGVTVSYVLKRDSNYALAAYPIVRHALDHGVIKEEDDVV